MEKRKLSMFRYIFIVVLLSASFAELQAQDWPQWRGPNRDGISKETGLNLDWTAKKPKLLWTFRDAGAGYSAPVIVGTTIIYAYLLAITVFLLDFVYALVDPRVKIGSGGKSS